MNEHILAVTRISSNVPPPGSADTFVPRRDREGFSLNSRTRDLTTAGLLLALAVLLPLAFHAFDLGQAFLPMHIPALLGGFLLPWTYAGIVGLLAPLLSSLLTGMPPMPYGVAMVFELAAYGAVASLLYRGLKWGQYPTLLGAMVIGRVVSGLANWTLAVLVTGKVFSLTVFMSSVTIAAMPGIVTQLILIPLVIALVRRSRASQPQ